MRTKYIVRLKGKEQKYLKKVLKKGKDKARKLTRCRILLLLNANKSDSEIIEVLDTARNTIRQVRERYINEGLERAINERIRPCAPVKFNGKQRVKITAIACSKPPEGRSRWTLQLLADKVVELDIAECISYKTIERILKKTNLSLI